jgi:hypothetical protein
MHPLFKKTDFEKNTEQVREECAYLEEMNKKSILFSFKEDRVPLNQTDRRNDFC